MDAEGLARMRQDRRKQSVAAAMMQPSRPSAAVPRQTLNRPPLDRPPVSKPRAASIAKPARKQTIRFTDPPFQGTAESSCAGSVGGEAAAKRRADSLVAPSEKSPQRQQQEASRRKSSAESPFQSRSWSIFWDPRIRATAGGDGSADGSGSISRQDRRISSAESGDDDNRRPSFMSRCKRDRLLHVVLGMVILVGSALIVAGVVWSVTHQRRVMEDQRDFACGKGIAGGPKCSVRLKGEEAGLQKASFVDAEVVDWWLKNHCVWRNQEKEWWCGSEIGEKQGEGDDVLPDGTWFERAGKAFDEPGMS